MQELKLIDAASVRRLLPMSECIDAMIGAMTAVSSGRVAMPPRILMPLIDRSAYLVVMPGSSADPLVYGTKIVSVHPENAALGRPAIQGFVALFDHASGALLALVDGAAITAIRTAAVSALATRELARPDARTLGVLGCGVQAASHVEAMCAVRPIEEIRIWGRSIDKARALAASVTGSREHAARAVVSAQEAAECDVVCVLTGAHEPVIRGAWVQPGAHINLVGAHTATTREADSALIARARVYVDSRESAAHEAGDLLIPLEECAIGADHVLGELGEVLLGKVPGRQTADEVTVYKSLGIVAQDLVAAWCVYQRCQAAAKLEPAHTDG
jgi:ornithine cyclodeaminase/alanine dehydrogenase-like protein (mu-crystallin family)